MEEKKLDKNSIIGFILIFGIMMFWLWQNSPTPEELEAQEKAKQEQVEAQKKAEIPQQTKVITAQETNAVTISDSLKLINLQNKLGAFAYSGVNATDEETLVESDLLAIKFNNKGGYVSEIKLKEFVNYDSIPIFLIKDNNAVFNINFATQDSRILNTKDLYFEPSVTKKGEVTLVSMKLKVSETKFLEYLYEIKEGDYMMRFTVRSQGLSNVINSAQDVNLNWNLKAYRNAKSVTYENRYTELVFEYEDGKDDYLGQQDSTEDTANDVTYVAFKQHFFTSILLADTPFKTGKFRSENLVQDEEIDTVYTKAFSATLPLELTAGEINKSMDWYYGPSDYKILNDYGRNLDEIIPLGWGIFGWINRYLFIPLFSMLGGYMPYGIAIIVMTVLIKLLMSFVQYKQFLSQAKLKILKPELDAIREKHKNNKAKAQQETLALQTKAGASPMAGCLPALVQLPVFYALFQFFPSAFDLRQKSFLWVEDLSSYDTIVSYRFIFHFMEIT